MKFTVGIQYGNADFLKSIIEKKEHIREVYFAFGDFANGRGNQLVSADLPAWEMQALQLETLQCLSAAGIKLNLLLNGNCYGAESLSRLFFDKVGTVCDYISERFGLGAVTTSSPLIAKFLKNNFSHIDVRASVNMGLRSIVSMEYISDFYDSFYAARELNRFPEKLAEIRKWCDSNGKKLFILANSGCLNDCSARTFHDNLVAHETEIAKMDNAYDFHGVCTQYLKKKENLQSLIRDTNFIRPEDVAMYDGIVDAVKLATRVNRDPIRVLDAYVGASYKGNILDLLEPAHNIYPFVLENGVPLKIVSLEKYM